MLNDDRIRVLIAHNNPLIGRPCARVLELFETNFHRPIGLGDMADAVRMSKSHFSRAFSGSVGESPARYLRRYRVKLAQEVMLSTSKSLSEIARNCGFAGQSHFTGTFSRMVGVSPAAWRRNLSEGPRVNGWVRLAQQQCPRQKLLAHRGNQSVGSRSSPISVSAGLYGHAARTTAGETHELE